MPFQVLQQVFPGVGLRALSSPDYKSVETNEEAHSFMYNKTSLSFIDNNIKQSIHKDKIFYIS